MKDHEGLQAVSDGDGGKEVVPQPEVHALERSSSFDQPEAYTAYTEAPKYDANDQAQFATPSNGAGYAKGYTGVPSDDFGGEKDTRDVSKPKLYCGLARRRFLWVVGIIAVVTVCIILAVVLGVVLGTTRHQDTDSDANTSPSSPSPTSPSYLQLRNLSGIASVSQGDDQGTTYGYYQDTDGLIRERVMSGIVWETDSSAHSDEVVVPSNIRQASPIAAIAHNFTQASQNGTWRFVFFQDPTGAIMMTNRTESTNWTEPMSIMTSNDIATPDDIALEALSVPNVDYLSGIDGVRVYYGSGKSGLGELLYSGRPGGNGSWFGAGSQVILDVDQQSGVGTTSYNQVLHVYTRNNESGLLNQWKYYYHNSDWNVFWAMVAESSDSNPPVASGSDITACSDMSGNGTDYIFYQTTNGSVVRALSSFDRLSNFVVLPAAVPGSKLDAVYSTGNIGTNQSGPVVFYQAQTAPNLLEYVQVDRDGNLLNSGSTLLEKL